MGPYWNIARRTSAKCLNIHRLSTWPIVVPKTGVRAMSSSSHNSANILKSSWPDVEQPHGNLINTVFENVHRWGSKTAVECSVTGRQYTYNQVLDGIAKWAGFLTKLGFGKGDVIAVHMPNCPEYPIVVFGALSLGVVVSTINHNYTAEELMKQLHDSEAQLLVGDPSLEGTILSGLALYKQPLPLIMNGPSTAAGALNFQEILKNPTLPYADSINMTGEELAVLPYSSGTTGPPKGVMISHNALSVNLRMGKHPAFFGSRETTDEFQESFLCLLPFYHIYGFFISLFGFNSGYKIVSIPQFNPNTYINTITKNKAETLHLVPPLVNFLIHSPAATQEKLASVRNVFVGAAPLAQSSAEAFKDKFNKDIFFQEAYGMTEVAYVSGVPVDDGRIETCGMLLPNVSAKIIDTQTGRHLPLNETGEICLKTPAMMKGYFQNEAATFSTIDEEGWLHSGDVGSFDEDGFLKIVDRTKELIKVKGHQVSPSELEDVIRQHAQVLDVGVVGVPHDRTGEAPRAYIITKSQMTQDDIHRFIDSRVAPHKKLLGGIVFVKELPRNPTGKLLRRDLKNLALG